MPKPYRRRGRLRKLIVDRVDLVDDGANPGAHIVLFKRESHPEDGGGGTVPDKNKEVAVPELDLSTLDPEVQKSIEQYLEEAQATAVQTAVDEALEKFKTDLESLKPEEPAAGAADDTPKPIDKSQLPEDVVKRLDEAEELEKRVAKMEREGRLASFTKRVESEFANLAGLEGELLMEVADAVGEETFGKLAQVLKAANAAIDTGELFKEAGHSRIIDGNSEVETLIKAKMEADPSLTHAQALDAVLVENPEIFEKSRRR